VDGSTIDGAQDSPRLHYEDDVLRVVLKPAGQPVLGPSGEASPGTLAAAVLSAWPALQAEPFPVGFAAGALHRLDTSTSGMVLFARTAASLGPLRALFAEHKLRKRYLLIARRDPGWPSHRIGLALAHHPQKRDRMVVQRGEATPHRGRWLPAETLFRRIGPAALPAEDGQPTLFSAEIRTGVMHQIRAHAAFLGMPLVGDRRYGGGPAPSGATAGVEFFLHHTAVIGGGLQIPAAPVPQGWPVAAPGSATA
jgi:23S rRNA pseudouridine1911/1915/1917 synthase